MTVFVDAHHHGCLASRVADGLDLLQVVGPGQQVLAAFEQLAAKIRAQTEGQNRNAASVHHVTQLPDLRLAEELRFVDQHAIERATLGNIGVDKSQQIIGAGKAHAVRAQANARGHHTFARAVVQHRRQDARAHATLVIVVGALQQRGRLAGIHRRVIEIEFGHWGAGNREWGIGNG